jgi:hypothetical protein
MKYSSRQPKRSKNEVEQAIAAKQNKVADLRARADQLMKRIQQPDKLWGQY